MVCVQSSRGSSELVSVGRRSPAFLKPVSSNFHRNEAKESQMVDKAVSTDHKRLSSGIFASIPCSI